MKLLLECAHHKVESCYPDRRPVVFVMFILLLSASLFSGCSSSKKSKINSAPVSNLTPSKKTTTSTPALVTENAQKAEVKNSTLMVTFSTSNDLLKHYPHFKLGLFDIIVYVRSEEGTLYKQSLYDLAPVSEAEYTRSTPLELTRLKKDSYLYHGIFNVPAGTLESVNVQFSGTKSSIAMGDVVPALIDAFFFSYTEGDARLPARLYPAEVTTGVPAGFILTEDNMGMLCIDVDMNLSAGMEPLMHSNPERKYALFVPAISARPMDSDVSMTIKQTDLITMKDGNMGVGDPEVALLTSAYTLDESATLSINADSVSDLNDVSGIYAIDMMGTFSNSSNGHSYVIHNASILSMAEDSSAFRYEGKVSVSGESITLKGYRDSLKIDVLSVKGSEYFSGDIVGNPTGLGLDDGDMAVIWSDGVTSKVIMKHDVPASAVSKEVFELRSTVSITPADILAIKSASKDETHVTLTLPEPLACADYITDVSTGVEKNCDNALTAIDITLANTGKFTLVETRKGTFLTVEEVSGSEGQTEEPQLPELALESDIVYHFDTAGEFFKVLEAKVSTEGYRLAVMIAEGRVDETTFKVGDMAKAIILQPHSLLDADAEGWIAGLESSVSDQLDSTNKRNVGFYTGLAVGGAVVAALGAYLINRTLKYNQTKHLGTAVGFVANDDILEATVGLGIEDEAEDSNRRYSVVIKKGNEKFNVRKYNVNADGSVSAVLQNTQKEDVDANGKVLASSVKEADRYVKVIHFDGKPANGAVIRDLDTDNPKTPYQLFKDNLSEQIKIIKYPPTIEWDADNQKYKFGNKIIDSINITLRGTGVTAANFDLPAGGTISERSDGIKVRVLQTDITRALYSFDNDGILRLDPGITSVKILSGGVDISSTLIEAIEYKKKEFDVIVSEAEKTRVVSEAQKIRAIQNGSKKKFNPFVILSETTGRYIAANNDIAKTAKRNGDAAKAKLTTRVADWFGKIFHRKKK